MMNILHHAIRKPILFNKFQYKGLNGINKNIKCQLSLHRSYINQIGSTLLPSVRSQNRSYATKKKKKSKKKSRTLKNFDKSSFFNDIDDAEDLLNQKEEGVSPVFDPFMYLYGIEPVPKKKPVKHEYHGYQIVDNFEYLEDVEKDEDARKYYSGEENYSLLNLSTDFGQTSKLFFNEITSTVTEHEPVIMKKIDDYYYYSKRGTYDTIYYRKNGLKGEEEIILDGDRELQSYNGKVMIKAVKVSLNHRYLAFSRVRDSFNNVSDVEIRDLDNRIIVGTIENVLSFEWGNDNESIYFIESKKDSDYLVLKKWILGESSYIDIYKKDKNDHYLTVYNTSDGQQIFITDQTDKDVSTILVFPNNETLQIYKTPKIDDFILNRSNGKFCAIVKDSKTLLSSVKMFDITNALRYDQWEEVIPHIDNASIMDMETFSNYIVLHLKVNSEDKFLVYHVQSKQSFYVPLPSQLSTVSILPDEDYNGPNLKFILTSPTHPLTIYNFNMDDQTLSIIDKLTYTTPNRPHNESSISLFNPDHFKEYKVFVGENKVPLSIVHKKSLDKNGLNPTIVRVYGSLGKPLDTQFDPSHISLLERGWVIAYAHVRGGNECGPSWHTNIDKYDSIQDYMECVRYLIENNYTSSPYLFGKASSEGCVILGFIANNYPHVFNSFIMNDPLLDLLPVFMRDQVPLIEEENEEFGYPIEKKEDFEKMLSYDPYTNIKPQDYPNILIHATSEFQKYPASQSIKYAAKLRQLKSKSSKIFVKSGLFNQPSNPEILEAKLNADEMAFLYGMMNILPIRFDQ